MSSHSQSQNVLNPYVPPGSVDGVNYDNVQTNALYYTLYLASTDEIVAFGTARNCARMLGMTVARFHQLISRIRTGRNKKFEFYAEPVDPKSKS